MQRESGDLLWVLGEPYSEWELLGASAPMFDAPHSVQRIGNDLLVFNRCLERCECSESVWIELDFDDSEATEWWAYESEPCLTAHILGNAEQIWNGNIMTVWSTAGQIDEVSMDQGLVWRLNLAEGAEFGLATRAESLYP